METQAEVNACSLWYTPEEAAALLGLTCADLYRLAGTGGLTYRRTGRKRFLFGGRAVWERLAPPRAAPETETATARETVTPAPDAGRGRACVWDGIWDWARRAAGVPLYPDGETPDEAWDLLMPILDTHPATIPDAAKRVDLWELYLGGGNWKTGYSYEAEVFAWLRWGGSDRAACPRCHAPARPLLKPLSLETRDRFRSDYDYKCERRHRFHQAEGTALERSRVGFDSWVALAVMLCSETPLRSVRRAGARTGRWVTAEAAVELLGLPVTTCHKMLCTLARVADTRRRQSDPFALLSALLSLPYETPRPQRAARRAAPPYRPAVAPEGETRFALLDVR